MAYNLIDAIQARIESIEVPFSYLWQDFERQIHTIFEDLKNNGMINEYSYSATFETINLILIDCKINYSISYYITLEARRGVFM